VNVIAVAVMGSILGGVISGVIWLWIEHRSGIFRGLGVIPSFKST
jgi:hypothetical protein